MILAAISMQPMRGGLCTPGKPPSARWNTALPESNRVCIVMAIVKLIGITQQLAANGPVSIPNAKTARELARPEHIQALNIESLLAVPLVDTGEAIRYLSWSSARSGRAATDIVVLKTIA